MCPQCGEKHAGVEFDTPKSKGRDETPVELGDFIVGALLGHKLDPNR